MGSGFLIAAQWTIEPVLYIIGFIFVMVQTSSRKQWNLVALNMNGLIAWIRHLLYSIYAPRGESFFKKRRLPFYCFC
jgi:hypothetical protein